MSEHIKQVSVEGFGTKWQANYKVAHKLSIFLGAFGIDRFYIGDYWVGGLKLLFTIPIFGGLPNGLLISIPWWIIDIFIISRHKADFVEWIEGKRAKKNEKKAKERAVAESLRRRRELEAERKSNGQCPKCGSDRLTAVSETNSSADVGTLLMRAGSPSKHYVDNKVKSQTVRVCLNCGHKF